LNSEAAGATGIILIVRYAEPSFHKTFSSFFPVIQVIFFAQSQIGAAVYIVRRATHGLYNHAVAPPFTAALPDSFEREDQKKWAE
jgi:hypothetical protein